MWRELYRDATQAGGLNRADMAHALTAGPETRPAEPAMYSTWNTTPARSGWACVIVCLAKQLPPNVRRG